MGMTASDWAAWWGAIVSTAVAIHEYWASRPRIVASACIERPFEGESTRRVTLQISNVGGKRLPLSRPAVVYTQQAIPGWLVPFAYGCGQCDLKLAIGLSQELRDVDSIELEPDAARAFRTFAFADEADAVEQGRAFLRYEAHSWATRPRLKRFRLASAADD